MIVPSDAVQLLAVLVLVVPAIVFAAIRRWLRGPVPEDRDFSVRLVQAIAVSVFLDLGYAICFGPTLVTLADKPSARPGGPHGFATNPREAAWIGSLLLVAIPGLLGLVGQPRVQRVDGLKLGITTLPRKHPTPTAWDRAAPPIGDCFVRIFTEDGKWVGGEIRSTAYVSTYPEERDIYLSVEWRLDADGAFIEPVKDSLGLYVPLGGNARVAWIYSPSEQD